MKVTAQTGREGLATVYMGETEQGRLVEFVESVQPPLPVSKKWVIIVSTLFGCPIKCAMCDAGYHYRGKLSAEQIFAQIDFLVKKRFPSAWVDVEKFKVQFARVGEPTLNANVLTVLKKLPARYHAPGLMPCLSTVAPAGTGPFFEELAEIKEAFYPGRFQLQFSVHATDEALRDRLIPFKKWGLAEIARYGERFFAAGDRKIGLNFALADRTHLEAPVLQDHFDPEKFLIKITPVNPTYQAARNNLSSYVDPYHPQTDDELFAGLRSNGFEVLLSVGEPAENLIGSNCGQYILSHLGQKTALEGGYSLSNPEPLQANPDSA